MPTVPPFNLTPQGVKNIKAIERVGVDKFNAGWVKFGNDRLNINTTSATGLEKALGVIARFIMKTQSKINEILYGKFSSGKEDANLIKRLLNKGVINLLQALASVDFCNILNYALSQTPDGKAFDPTKSPPSSDVIGRKKWQLQKVAYDVQQFIDRYYRDYLDTNNPESRVGLFLLIQEINSALTSFVSNVNEGLNDPLIKENFPQVSVANNFLQNALGIFNKYTNPNEIAPADVKKLIENIDKVRQYCIIIQGLNSPKNVVSFIDTSLNGNIQKELSDLSSLILDPNKAASILKSVIKTVNNINTIAQKILGYINTVQIITKICISLIKIFNVISAFLTSLPIGNVATTAGQTTKFSDVLQDKIKEKGKKKLITRLEQISAILNLMAIVVTSLVVAIQNIIGKLQVIQSNLENCSNKNQDLLNEINDAIDSLTKTSQKLNDFLTQYNNQQQRSQSQFGKYIIQIVTEEVVDESIRLKRRYGIARDTNGFIVVQSTPTFASLDLIIINEVKTLLVSKGLVSANISGLSTEDQVVVLEAARFLGDDEIDLGNIEISIAELETLQDQEDELGINSFVNNLPGGRALRRRIREKMLKNSRQLSTDLQATDPGGRFSSGITAGQQSQNNRLEIQDLENKIAGWKKQIAESGPGSGVSFLVVRDLINKIKDAEKRIQQLRQG